VAGPDDRRLAATAHDHQSPLPSIVAAIRIRKIITA
jgi:hypothetical protein